MGEDVKAHYIALGKWFAVDLLQQRADPRGKGIEGAQRRAVGKGLGDGCSDYALAVGRKGMLEIVRKEAGKEHLRTGGEFFPETEEELGKQFFRPDGNSRGNG